MEKRGNIPVVRTAKAAGPTLFYEDEVVRLDKNGRVRFGMVVENSELASSDEEGDDERAEEESPADRRVKAGFVRVAWHPRGNEEIVPERKVMLSDRSIMSGDVVRRLDKTLQGGQLGYCRNVEVLTAVRIVGTKTVVYGVNTKDLTPLVEFAEDVVVYFRSWVGVVKTVNDQIVLGFKDGSECVLGDRDADELEDVDDREEDSQFERSAFYPGQILFGPAKTFEKGVFTSKGEETKRMLKQAAKKNKSVRATVTQVKAFSIGVNWQCQVFSADLKAGEAPPGKPNYLLQGEDLKSVKSVNHFEPCSQQIGDRNHYLLKETDALLTIDQWKKLEKQSLSQKTPPENDAEKCQKDPKKRYSKRGKRAESSSDNSSDYETAESENSDSDCCDRQRRPFLVANVLAPKRKLKRSRKFPAKGLNDLPKAAVRVTPGETLVVETLVTRSEAEVVWQDGTVEKCIPSKELFPIHHLDDQEFFSGDLVVKHDQENNFDPRIYGVVQKCDHDGRMCTVRWFRTYSAGKESVPQCIEETEEPVYDLKDHPDFTYRPGSIVVRVSGFKEPNANFSEPNAKCNGPSVEGGEPDDAADCPLCLAGSLLPVPETMQTSKVPSPLLPICSFGAFEPEEGLSIIEEVPSFIERPSFEEGEPCEAKLGTCGVGQVLDNLTNGLVRVWWVDQSESSCFPQDLFKIGEYDSDDDGGLWDDDEVETWDDFDSQAGSDGSWETESEHSVVDDHGDTRRESGKRKARLSGNLSEMVHSFLQQGDDNSTQDDTSKIDQSDDISSDLLPNQTFLNEMTNETGMSGRIFATPGNVTDGMFRAASGNNDAGSSSYVIAGNGSLGSRVSNFGNSRSSSTEEYLSAADDTDSTGETPGGSSITIPDLSTLATPGTSGNANHPADAAATPGLNDAFLAPSGRASRPHHPHNHIVSSTPHLATDEVFTFHEGKAMKISPDSKIGRSVSDAEAAWKERPSMSPIHMVHGRNEDEAAAGMLQKKKPLEEEFLDVSVFGIAAAALEGGDALGLEEVQAFSFCPTAPATHFYKNTTFQPTDAKGFMKVVRREIQLLRSNLPPGIVVKAYEDRMDLYSVLITGPQKTPYEDGVFFFDFQLPADYPKVPPVCHYLSYCSDRLNPNLYEDGKVCVSLLGTWSGKGSEQWTPISSMLQVLVSIQGLILVGEPYYNEAGYEKHRDTQEGLANSRLYNEMVLLKLVQSMARTVTGPPEVFRKEVKRHFVMHGKGLITRVENWRRVSSQPKDQTEKSPGNPEIELPDFPLLPASKGFCISLGKALEGFRTALNESNPAE